MFSRKEAVSLSGSRGVIRLQIMKNFKPYADYIRCLITSSRMVCILFEVIEKLFDNSIEKLRFRKKLGCKLDLINPASFNQKLVWKKLYDRNPLLPVTSDKYAVRFFVKDVFGTEEAEKILIPLLYMTDQPENIPFDELPEEYVIKANHGYGAKACIFVKDDAPPDKGNIIRVSKKWLGSSYGALAHEWAYQSIKRKVIIEKLVKDENGNLPKDYKFFIFHGKCRLIQVDHNRFSKHVRTLYSPDWKPLEISYSYPRGQEEPVPSKIDRMIYLSEKLSKHFDFVRVDLYIIEDRIYFGELTHYPESGLGRFSPDSFDFELGKYWKLEREYWKES